MANGANVQQVPVGLTSGVTAALNSGAASRHFGGFLAIVVLLGADLTPTPMQYGAAVYRKPNAQPTSGPQARATAAAFLPMFTGDAHGTTVLRALGIASLPMFTTAVSADVVVQALATATLPMFVGTAAALAIVAAHGSAVLPALGASASVTTGTRRYIRSWQQCPRPASGFTECKPGSLRRGKPEPT